MILDIAGRTEKGPIRERNEDHILIGGWIRQRGWLALRLDDDDEQIMREGLLLAVADGMGGEAGGQIASRLALEGLNAALARTTPPGGSGVITSEDLSEALLQANATVRQAQGQDPGLAGMGTTLSGLLFTATGYWVLHAGDSRILRIRNGFVRPLTRDDNLEERLITQGVDAERAAAHPEAAALTNWVGAEAMQPRVLPGDVALPGDQLLICSDGLHGFVNKETLVRVLGDPQSPIEACAAALVDEAIAAGSTDNVSVIIIRMQDPLGLSQEVDHEHR